MAKYGIKMSCGHTEAVQLFGKGKDADRKIAWLEENGECAACYKARRDAEHKAATENAAAKATAENLPALTGSEKQINWALTIRANKLDDLDKMVADTNAKIADQAQRDKNQMACQAARNVLVKKTESKFWIDNRDISAKRLIAVNNLQDAFKAEFARLTAAANETPSIAVDPADYAINPDAMQVAIDTEIANAAANITNTIKEDTKMTITAKTSQKGRTSYYVDGKKVRKTDIDGIIISRRNEIIEVDYYDGQEFKLLTRGCFELKVVFTGTGEDTIMTKAAAKELGYEIIRKFVGGYNGRAYLVEKKADVDPADYAISNEAFDIAVNAEIDNARDGQVVLAEIPTGEYPKTEPQMNLDDQADYICDKHNREVKPCDDNDAVFDLLPDLDDLNDVDSVPAPESAPEPKKDCTTPLADDLIFVGDDDTKKLAELKANYDAAKVATDNADADLCKAREIVEEKLKKAIAAENAEFKAKCALHDYLREVADDLTANLITPDISDAKLFITNQRGTEFEHEKSLFALRVKDGYISNFEIAMGYLVFGEYDTPAQVEKVIDLLKAAINRGEKEFKFPTIDDLNSPPPKKNSVSDSLARAMEIALEECQKYCREHNLPAAQNELELFKICSEALENHHAQATIQANCDSVNETAPEGWHVAPCADKPDQYQITYNGDNVTTLDSLVLAKILTPDKFFGQFAPLNDKNFSPQNQFITDLKRELSELEKMRQELPADSPQLKTLDDMIDQTNRDIFQTEMSPT